MTLTESQHFSRDLCHQRKTFRAATNTRTRNAAGAFNTASYYDVCSILEHNYKPAYICHVG